MPPVAKNPLSPKSCSVLDCVSLFLFHLLSLHIHKDVRQKALVASSILRTARDHSVFSKFGWTFENEKKMVLSFAIFNGSNPSFPLLPITFLLIRSASLKKCEANLQAIFPLSLQLGSSHFRLVRRSPQELWVIGSGWSKSRSGRARRRSRLANLCEAASRCSLT